MSRVQDAPQIAPYRKKVKKKTPKKADHKHEYEAIVLSYINPNRFFTKERGFFSGHDSCPGRRCTICGRLELGFPKGVFPEHKFWMTGQDLIIKYPGLPVVEVNDIFKLNND